ncbi:MAG: ATP-binding cassette subfamily C protein EexD [Psychrobacter glaciei]
MHFLSALIIFSAQFSFYVMELIMLDSNVVEAALSKAKKSMLTVLAFSFVVNLLLLTSPLFMLQVYDRVLLSQSKETLIALVCVAVFCLVILAFMETIRSWLLNRIAVRFDKDLGEATFSEVMSEGENVQPIHNLNSIRSFLNAPYILALFDVPWMPLYIGFVYMLHPMLGHIGLAGALVLFILAIINDAITRYDAMKASQCFGGASRFVEHGVRNKDAILGMGMLPALGNIWSMYQKAGMGHQSVASDRNALISSIAKVFRQLIQVSVLAVGAYLTIEGVTTAGVMIAASIIIARALAPVEQSIQGWRSLAKTKQSYAELKEFMAGYAALEPSTQLPEPNGDIALQNVVSVAVDENQERRPIIRNLSLKINVGDVVGITGPSGSGKSSVIKLILGIVQPSSGVVRIDGAQMNKDVREQFSPHIGYLPQEVELFDGTVAENIARFTEAEPEAITNAAITSGAHELILSLPKGYETRVGPSGSNLSGGQRQRIGLARAIFNQPSIVILDEPSSNLDQEGSVALLNTIDSLQQKNTTVVMVAHQHHLFRNMNKIAVIRAGQLEMYGPAQEVLNALQPKSVSHQVSPQSSANV